jgi:hypothetical protein
MNDDEATTALKLTNRIAPLLAGHPPEVQSAVLADLTAMWIAGHQVPQKTRKELFGIWCKLVLDLVPVNDEMLRERRARRQ